MSVSTSSVTGASRNESGHRFLTPPAPLPTMPVVVPLQLLPAVGAIIVFMGEYRSVTALAVLCVVSAICAGFYVVGRAGLVSFGAIFVMCFIGLYLLYPVTSLLLDLPIPADERLAEYAFLTVGGLSLFLVAHAIGSRRVRRIEVRPLQEDHLGVAFWLFLAPLFAALLLLASTWPSLSELVTATRFDIKEAGNLRTLAAQYLWTAGSVGIVLGPLYLRRNFLGWIPFLLLLAAAGAAGFLAFRTRSILILLATSVLMGLWLSRQIHLVSGAQNRSRQSRIALRSPAIWRWVFLGTVLIVAISYVRIARGLFEERGAIGLAEVDVAQAVLHNLQRGDLAYAPIVFDVLGFVPEHEGYLWGQSYYRLLFTPIPRALWPEKPQNTQRVVASWLHPGKSQQTTPPGIQGDLFINFGYVGVLGFLMFGYVFGLLDRWHGLGSVLAIGAGITPVFHLVRGGFTNPVLLLLVLFLTAYWAAAVAEGRVRSIRFHVFQSPGV